MTPLPAHSPTPDIDGDNARDRISVIGRELRRMRSDLAMARKIQRRLLPELPQHIGGLKVAAEYRPAFEVGGDFYDLVPTRDGDVVAVMGDVSGKGVAAALIMAHVTAEFRRAVETQETPGKLLAELNRALVGVGDDTFVTTVCLRFDATRRQLAIANAGHLPPIVRRRSGETFMIGENTGAPLAMFLHEDYPIEHVQLDEGDVVIMMTDGVTEPADLDLPRVREIVASAPHCPTEICRRLLERARRGIRRADDLAMLALQVP
jgi:serine phosphatase RsbU (regulator of sigma subunit)